MPVMPPPRRAASARILKAPWMASFTETMLDVSGTRAMSKIACSAESMNSCTSSRAGVALRGVALAGGDELAQAPLLADQAGVGLDVRHRGRRVAQLRQIRGAADLSQAVAVTQPRSHRDHVDRPCCCSSGRRCPRRCAGWRPRRRWSGFRISWTRSKASPSSNAALRTAASASRSLGGHARRPEPARSARDPWPSFDTSHHAAPRGGSAPWGFLGGPDNVTLSSHCFVHLPHATYPKLSPTLSTGP